MSIPPPGDPATLEDLLAAREAAKAAGDDREATRLNSRYKRLRAKVGGLVTKQCLACGVTYQGTPASTRCDTCKSEGRMVSSASQRAGYFIAFGAIPRPKPHAGPAIPNLQTRIYRCKECVRLEKEAKAERKRIFEAELASISEMDDRSLEKLEAELEEQTRSQWRRTVGEHLELLHRRDKKPRGYKQMTKATAKSPLGIIWLHLCDHDGQAAAAFHTPLQVSHEDNATLLLTYHRLRLKGFRPDAIAKLCPKALLEPKAQDALTGLPIVTEEDDREEPTGDLVEVAQEILAQQDRELEARALGLAH